MTLLDLRHIGEWVGVWFAVAVGCWCWVWILAHAIGSVRPQRRHADRQPVSRHAHGRIQ